MLGNLSSGETGGLIAREASRHNCRVTLLLGPAPRPTIAGKWRLKRFTFYKDLRQQLRRELKAHPFDWIVHAAAVSDFRPQRFCRGKLDSGKALTLRLVPLPKIASSIRTWAPRARLVVFKLAPGSSDRRLKAQAVETMRSCSATLVVANRLKPYRAFLISASGETVAAESKAGMAAVLVRFMTKGILR